MEITDSEQQQTKKELKEIKTIDKTFDTRPSIDIIGVPKGEEKEKTWENRWRDDSWKLLNMGKEIVSSPGSGESQAAYKSKEEHIET